MSDTEITSVKGYVEAIDTVILLARQQICMFDDNLAGAGFNSLERYTNMLSFLRRDPKNGLRIVLHRTDYLERYCPRMLTLLRQFSHRVSIRKTLPEAAAVYDPVVIADDCHYVHRFHFENNRGLMGTADSTAAAGLKERFEEIWEASEPSIGATTLGL